MESALPIAVPFVRFAEVVNWPPCHKWGPRRLYDHELLYVLNGGLEFTLEDRVVTASANHLLLVPPRALNQYRTSPQSAHSHIGIHFDWVPRDDTQHFEVFRAAEEPFEESLFRPEQNIPGWDSQLSPLLDLSGRPLVGQLLHEVVEAFALRDEFSRVQAGGLLAVAIAQIARETKIQAAASENPRAGADAVRRVHRARELLEAPQRELPTVSQVAAQVGWSADHLNRMCRCVLGASPQAIRTRARVRRVSELLRYGHADLADVAWRCGFCDVSHLTRVFRKELGVSPRDFLRAQSSNAVKQSLFR